MPGWIQYLPFGPEYALLTVVAVPIMSFMLKLRRRIRNGEYDLKAVLHFWYAMLIVIAAVALKPVMFEIWPDAADWPMILSGGLALTLAPGALRNWSKEPKAEHKRRSIELLAQIDPLLTPTPTLPARSRTGLEEEHSNGPMRRVSAGRLNMKAVWGIGIAGLFGLFWLNLWFRGLLMYGWPFFLPVIGSAVAMFVFSRFLYRGKILVDETTAGEGPVIDLPNGIGQSSGLPTLPRPRFGKREDASSVPRG